MISKSLGTHDGSFHADEVTAAALLVVFKKVNRDLIRRSRDLAILADCEYVCDVGGLYQSETKRFDHHQIEYIGNLSSAGMVWQYLNQIGDVSDKLYSFINAALILGVDAHDNGKAPVLDPGVCTFSQIITNFVPVSYQASAEEQTQAFFEALDFTIGHIERLVQRFHYIEGCRTKVSLAMKAQSKYLLFDESLPWIDLFFDMGGEHHPALFVIMPAGVHWKLRAIPPNQKDRMNVRKPLPKEWAGLMDNDLKKVSGISGAIFCHKGRFVSVWQSRQDALQALDLTLKEQS